MPYKISGTKSETGRVIIIKESNWTIESNTVVSGSGSYSIEDLETGSKLTFSRAEDGEIVGFGAVSPSFYAPAEGDRGVFAGGYDGSGLNVIDYITISTLSDATYFGDLTVARGYQGATSNGANGRGVFGGHGVVDLTNTIDYITISTTGDADDFGDLTTIRNLPAGTSNGTNDRGIFMGGYPPNSNVIDYITISTPSNAINFGELIVSRGGIGATSNGTNNRGVFGGGAIEGDVNQTTIEYVNISSTSNTTNFGDLTVARRFPSACSNGIRGVFGGGRTGDNDNTIDYITISTTGDATNFGDLTLSRYSVGATSNGTNNRGIFGGGGYEKFNVIDYITISTLSNATYFGDLTVARRGVTATSNA